MRNDMDLPLAIEQHNKGFMEEQGHYGNEENVKSEEEEESTSVGHSSKCFVRGHWRADEDAKLMELVSQNGPHNWNVIAKSLEGRSGKSCRLRWFNQLDPRIKKQPFTPEEDERLLAAQRAIGNRWSLIARLFRGRTDNAVKNHWHVIMSRMHRSHQRRRKITCIQNNAEVNNANNNACSGDSTITTTRDIETLSTSNNRVSPVFLTTYSPQFPQQGFDEMVARNGSSHEGGAPLRFVPGVDQYSAYSDSNSQASAPAESAVSHMNNNGALLHAHSWDHDRENINLPFIDFLGVGRLL